MVKIFSWIKVLVEEIFSARRQNKQVDIKIERQKKNRKKDKKSRGTDKIHEQMSKFKIDQWRTYSKKTKILSVRQCDKCRCDR